MRKGLVVTLGVVALLSAVRTGFAFAPVISCIPDIIISDAEQNQTSDQNFFIFSNALNLDEYVRDDDTTKTLLKWSFFESSTPGNAIMINRIGSLPNLLPATIKDPGANNLRAAGPWASFRNNLWSPISGSLPYPNPPGNPASMPSIIQMYVSDGIAISSQPISMTTANTGANAASDPNAPKDSKVLQSIKSFAFASSSEGWTWFDNTPAIPAPTHTAAGGLLTQTETANTANVVYGAWESPQDPTATGAIKSRFGCVLRARFKLSSTSASGQEQQTPGFRFRVWWTRVIWDAVRGGYIPDFYNPDFTDLYEAQYSTNDAMYVTGRVPGTPGKTYTVLYYPQQIDTLMTTNAITYMSCDLLDDDITGNDAGVINIDQVDVDGFDRPEIGAPGMTSVPALSVASDFSSWAFSRYQNKLDVSASTATLVQSANAAGITISCSPGTSLWEAGFNSAGVALRNGRYYRVLFRAKSSQTAGGDAVPVVRAGLISDLFSAWCNKRLEGGATFATLASTGTDYEFWYAAPTNLQSSSNTETFSVRFEGYIITSPDLRNKQQSGMIGCTRVTTEYMLALP